MKQEPNNSNTSESSQEHAKSSGPLTGITVIEVGQLLAGPFTGTLLGYFGANVIKIEPPKIGDPIRNWRILKDGTSLWWRSLGRNKKCVTLDLKNKKGQQVAKKMIDNADVLIENFRPGKMEGWGLGPEAFEKSNPKLIYTRISGYGQDGPYASRPGYASVTEGISGFRYINGIPDEPPIRPNLSLGDSVAGLHAAFGITMALLSRNRTCLGQVIDVALYESMFNLMEAIVPEYSSTGAVRQPSGTTVTGIVPTNTYRCKDGKYVIIGGNGDSIYKRLMHAAGFPDLAEDPELEHNPGRVRYEAKIDAALESWTRSHSSETILGALEKARVPSGPIYSVKDMFEDEHFQARNLFEEVSINNDKLILPAILPKLTKTPGNTRWPGPAIGENNEEIFHEWLGLTKSQIESLQKEEVI